jgi:hypothetical protein
MYKKKCSFHFRHNSDSYITFQYLSQVVAHLATARFYFHLKISPTFMYSSIHSVSEHNQYCMTYKKVDLALFYMVCNSSRVRKRHEFTSSRYFQLPMYPLDVRDIWRISLMD